MDPPGPMPAIATSPGRTGTRIGTSTGIGIAIGIWIWIGIGIGIGIAPLIVRTIAVTIVSGIGLGIGPKSAGTNGKRTVRQPDRPPPIPTGILTPMSVKAAPIPPMDRVEVGR